MGRTLNIAFALAALMARPATAADPHRDSMANLRPADVEMIIYTRTIYDCPQEQRFEDRVVITSCGRAPAQHTTSCYPLPPEHNAAMVQVLKRAQLVDRTPPTMGLDATIQVVLRNGLTIEIIIMRDADASHEPSGFFAIEGRSYHLGAEPLRAIYKISTYCPTS